MLQSLFAPIIFSLVATGLTVAAIRGKWIVFRLVVGTVAFSFTMIAAAAWMEFAWQIQSGGESGGDTALYIGWDPRALVGRRGLVPIGIFAGYMALVLWAGHRRAQKKLQGKD